MDKETATPEQIQEQTFKLLGEWENAKAQADASKAAELTARDAVVQWAGSEDIAKGVENIPLASGYTLKITKKINYNVDNAVARLQLTEIASTGEEGKVIADRIMSWKPSLSLTEYAKLKPEFKTLIDRCISTSVATPTIEIVPPKAK